MGSQLSEDHTCWGIDFETAELTPVKIRYRFHADLRDSGGGNISRIVELTRHVK